MKFLFGYKPLVDERVERFLRKKEKELSRVNQWGEDTIRRLLPFVTAGKTIRGSLLCYTYSLFQQKIPLSVIDAAAALELFQSGFLIHDDIMDKDDMRRGKPSFHIQYKSNDIAMCVGDLCFFLGYELLPSAVQTYVSGELTYVTIAQMQDVAGAKTQQDFISLYKYKTARYSFSLPLAVGAMLAGADKKTITQLEKLGEAMGMLFQIRDDELPRSRESDTRNKKRTLSSFGFTKEQHIETAHVIIQKLPIEEVQKSELVSLVLFCHNRTK